jgi:metal-responsive CopG/Arc/MetJ family transcriptional regulator
MAEKNTGDHKLTQKVEVSGVPVNLLKKLDVIVEGKGITRASMIKHMIVEEVNKPENQRYLKQG